MTPYLHRTDNLAPIIPNRALLHDMVCTAMEERFGLKGGVEPMWVVACGPSVGWLVTPFEAPGDKRLATMMIRDMLALTGAQAYSFVSECFVASLGENMTKAERQKWLTFCNENGVSALPASMREDALMVMSHGRDGHASVSRYLVTDRHGKGPNLLGPRVDEDPEGDGMAGPMFNLFMPEQEFHP